MTSDQDFWLLDSLKTVHLCNQCQFCSPSEEVDGSEESLLPLATFFPSSCDLVGALSGASPTTSNSTSFSKFSLFQQKYIYIREIQRRIQHTEKYILLLPVNHINQECVILQKVIHLQTAAISNRKVRQELAVVCYEKRMVHENICILMIRVYCLGVGTVNQISQQTLVSDYLQEYSCWWSCAHCF